MIKVELDEVWRCVVLDSDGYKINVEYTPLHEDGRQKMEYALNHPNADLDQRMLGRINDFIVALHFSPGRETSREQFDEMLQSLFPEEDIEDLLGSFYRACYRLSH